PYVRQRCGHLERDHRVVPSGLRPTNNDDVGLSRVSGRRVASTYVRDCRLRVMANERDGYVLDSRGEGEREVVDCNGVVTADNITAEQLVSYDQIVDLPTRRPSGRPASTDGTYQGRHVVDR